MDGVTAVQMQSPEEGRFITASGRPKIKRQKEKQAQRKLKSAAGKKMWFLVFLGNSIACADKTR